MSCFTFKTTKFLVPKMSCKPTNHLAYVRSNGVAVWAEKCVQVGMQAIKSTNDPITVPAWAVVGVKKNISMTHLAKKLASGMSNGGKGTGAVRDGWPQAVYKTKKQKKLVNLYGIKL